MDRVLPCCIPGRSSWVSLNQGHRGESDLNEPQENFTLELIFYRIFCWPSLILAFHFPCQRTSISFAMGFLQDLLLGIQWGSKLLPYSAVPSDLMNSTESFLLLQTASTHLLLWSCMLICLQDYFAVPSTLVIIDSFMPQIRLYTVNKIKFSIHVVIKYESSPSYITLVFKRFIKIFKETLSNK